MGRGRARRVVVHACVGLVVLSWLGGQPVSDFSQGLPPSWGGWDWLGDEADLEVTDVSEGFVIGGRFDGITRRSISYEVFSNALRDAFDEFKQLPRTEPAREVVVMPEWVLRSVRGGATGGTRGSVGFVAGVWRWDSQRSVPIGRNTFVYPESGVIRIAGVPFAVWPAFPGFLIAWALAGGLSFGVVAGIGAAARHIKRRSKRKEGCCGRCGYDLKGLLDGVCPECGEGAA